MWITLEIIFSNSFSKSITNFFSQHLMIKRSRLKNTKKIEDNIIKDVKNLFRLKMKQLTLRLKMQEIFLDWKNK